jgi:hypothetical protein
MRRNVLIASVALLAFVSVGCGDVHLHGGPRHGYHHRRRHHVYRHEPAPRVVHVHTRPAPPPRVVVHAPPPPPARPPVVVVRPDRHPGRGHAYGHHKHHHKDGELRIKAKGDNGSVDLRVKVDD